MLTNLKAYLLEGDEAVRRELQSVLSFAGIELAGGSDDADFALLGVSSQTALPQIPLPPLPPGLNVRITTGRPPAVRREIRSSRPGQDYLWINGFWANDGGRWEWVPGRWERRVQSGHVFLALKGRLDSL